MPHRSAPPRHAPRRALPAALVTLAVLAACADPSTAPDRAAERIAPSLAIIGTTTLTQLATPPASLQRRDDDATVFVAFQERENLALPAPLTLQIGGTGMYPAYGFSNPASPYVDGSTLAAGSRVDSYLIHFDPPNSSPATVISGSVTFDTDVVGVIVSDGGLDATDGVLGAAGTTYPTGFGGRRFLYQEGSATQTDNDHLSISPDRRTVTVRMFAGMLFIDQIRIVTCAAGTRLVSGQCVPVTTAEALCALTRSFVQHHGLANSMCQQLRNGAYRAFANHVRAQSGKRLTPAQAELLVALAETLS